MKKDHRVTLYKVVSSRMPIPARDRIIDFGKYKGRMLGTLPSKYLTWMSKKLRTRGYESWSKLAAEVLVDPIYAERIEWEFAERIMTGDGCRNSKFDPESALQDVIERFGWDFNDNNPGWRHVKLELLGTSMGGRIPRKDGSVGHGLANTGIKGIGSSGHVRDVSASQRRKERLQPFQERSSAKASPFGPFQSHAGKDRGSLEAASYVTRGSKEFKRFSGLKENKVGVLEQGKRMTTKEVEGFEDTLREKRQQRRVKQNLRRQQFHKSDRDIEAVEDRKAWAMDLMVTKQNDSSDVSQNFNPFPGRDKLLKKISERQ